MNNYIKDNHLKYRDIYYTFRDYLKKMLNDKHSINCIKHIVYIFNDLVMNIPHLIERNNYLILKETDFILDNLIEDLKKNLEDIFTIKNFKKFCFKLFVIKKTYIIEEAIFLLVNKYKYYIPYHHIDYYRNNEFNELINNWCYDIKKILPSNFPIINLDYSISIEEITNYIYSLEQKEFRKGNINLLELITFIFYFKQYINKINSVNINFSTS
jgi:hypothetical protein